MPSNWTHSELKTLRDVAVKAILDAGEVVNAFYNQSDLVKVRLKQDQSPVTEADLQSSLIIEQALQKTGIPMVGEESANAPFELRKTYASTWIVDPLDGTKGFINQTDQFCICIALVELGTPILGLIYDVVNGLLYSGGPRLGVNRLEVATENQSILNPTSFDSVLLTNGAECPNVLAELSHTYSLKDHKVLSSALKFTQILEGKASHYLRTTPCMEWDIAAGHALMLTIDKDVIGYPGTKTLIYNKEDLYVRGFLVG